MTQEEKDLLFKDLCARLPYGVKCEVIKRDVDGEMLFIRRDLELTVNNIKEIVTNNMYEIKPNLFPLSSMTEEQFNEMQTISGKDCLDHMEVQKSLRECTNFTHWPLYEYRVIDLFNKNHFDYRGLIPLGLANNATNLNIY